MIPTIPLIALIAIFGVLAAVFILFKSFKMPSSFGDNQKKRDALRKRNFLKQDELKKP